MRVSLLKSALDEIKSLFASGGAVAQANDLQKVVDLLDAQGDRELAAYLAEVESSLLTGKVSPITGKSSQAEIIDRLKAADLDEAEFKIVLADLASNRSLKKADAAEIARQYGVIRLETRSKAAIVESIEKHFYWMLYNRDANEMAKRATPW